MAPMEHQHEPTAETTRGEPYLLLSGSLSPSSSSLCSLFCRRLCLALDVHGGGLKQVVSSWGNCKAGAVQRRPCKPGTGKPVSGKPGPGKPGPGTRGQSREFISKRCCCTAARMVRSRKLWVRREQTVHMGSPRCIF